MGLTNSKYSYAKLVGKEIPTTTEEEIVFEMMQRMERGKIDRGLSILFYYLVAKTEQADIETVVTDKLSDLRNYMINLGNDVGALLNYLIEMENLSEMNVSRIIYLQKLINYANKLENEDELEPTDLREAEFLPEKYEMFITDLTLFKANMRRASIDVSGFDLRVNQLIKALEGLEKMCDQWVDLLIIESMNDDDMLQLSLFSNCSKIVREKISEITNSPSGITHSSTTEDYSFLNVVDFKKMELTQLVEILKVMEMANDENPF